MVDFTFFEYIYPAKYPTAMFYSLILKARHIFDTSDTTTSIFWECPCCTKQRNIDVDLEKIKAGPGCSLLIPVICDCDLVQHVKV